MEERWPLKKRQWALSGWDVSSRCAELRGLLLPVPELGVDLGRPRESWHGRTGCGAGSVWLSAAPLLCGSVRLSAVPLLCGSSESWLGG